VGFLKTSFLYRPTAFSKNNEVEKWLKSWIYWIWYLLKIPIFETIWGVLIFPLMMSFSSLEWLADFFDFFYPASSFTANADTLKWNQFFQQIIFFTNATIDFLIVVLIWVSGALMILSVLLDLVSSQNYNFRNHLGDSILSIDEVFFIP
jgi:hypothetical protein